MLWWSLVVIGAMFFISLGRWAYQLIRVFNAPPRSSLVSTSPPTEEIDPKALTTWVHSMSPGDDAAELADDGEPLSG